MDSNAHTQVLLNTLINSAGVQMLQNIKLKQSVNPHTSYRLNVLYYRLFSSFPHIELIQN